MPFYFEFSPIPLQVGTPLLWLDASAADTLFTDSSAITKVTADGDPVGFWYDRSGNGNNVIQTSGTNKPVYKTNIKNGKSILRFNGLTTWLNNTTISTINQPLTLIAVKKRSSSNPHTYGQYFGSTFNVCIIKDSSNAGYYDYMYSGVSLPDAGANSVDNFVSIVAIFNGASSSFQLNNRTTATGNAGAGALTRIDVGGSSLTNTSETFCGDIAELIAYPFALSGTNIINIQLYLNAKWGIY